MKDPPRQRGQPCLTALPWRILWNSVAVSLKMAAMPYFAAGVAGVVFFWWSSRASCDFLRAA